MLIALVVMTAMYAGLCFSIAEMSPALPHTGGAYSFARTAMGPWGGYITGLAENMEYILTPATIVVGIGGYLGAIFNTPKSWEPGWWIVCYIAVRRTECLRRGAVVPLLGFHRACGAARVDCVLDRRDPSRRFSSATRSMFPSKGLLPALPFALWLYLGNRATAASRRRVARPEARHAERHSLRAVDADRLFLSDDDPQRRDRARRGEAWVHRKSLSVLSFQTIAGSEWTKLFALVAVIGLVASFHTILYAYGRQIYSLSRAGYFPQWLSVTSPKHQTPVRALISGSALGMAAALGIYFFGQNSPGRCDPAEYGGFRGGFGVYFANGLVSHSAEEESWNGPMSARSALQAHGLRL